ncbi:MAG: hypothetical protein H6831_08760 [Planctomycetes bacterium]|nr:hypothetical protein [Planctomycetota bacterium]
MQQPRDIEGSLQDWLEEIDSALSASHVDFSLRPFTAVTLLIEHSAVAVDGEDIDPTKWEAYVQTPWFKKVHSDVLTWYREKYGPALRPRKSCVQAVIMIAGVPFELRIPTTLSRVETPGETFWLTFAATVHDREDCFSWIQNCPNVSRLAPDASKELSLSLVELATSLRTLRLDLSCANKPDPESSGLSDKVVAHLEAAAGHLLRRDWNCYGLAAWESHQAVESVLKLLQRQLTGSHRHSHELRELLDDLPRSIRSKINRKALEALPNSVRVIQLRAGEGKRVDLLEAHELYRLAVCVAHQAAQQLSASVRVHDASFLLRKAVWLE